MHEADVDDGARLVIGARGVEKAAVVEQLVLEPAQVVGRRAVEEVDGERGLEGLARLDVDIVRVLRADDAELVLKARRGGGRRGTRSRRRP